jgi:hypothetical protein
MYVSEPDTFRQEINRRATVIDPGALCVVEQQMYICLSLSEYATMTAASGRPVKGGLDSKETADE